MPIRSAVIHSRRAAEFIQPLLDACCILAALCGAQFVARGEIDEPILALGLVSIAVYQLVSHATGLHRSSQSHDPNAEVTSLALTWGATVLVLALIAYATRTGDYYARSIMVSWILLVPATIGLARMCFRIVQHGLLRRGVGVRRVAIAGYNELGRQMALNLEHEPSWGLRFIGFYEDRVADRQTDQESACEVSRGVLDVGDQQVIAGNWTELVEGARRGEIETVLVTLPMRAEARIRKLLDQLSDSTASVYIVPDIFVFELLHARWIHVGGLPAVSVFESPLFGVDGICKRALDVGLAVSACVVLSPVMLLIGMFVKLSSPGPVFFRQRRYGLDGREIRVWKFRSMRVCEDGATVKQASQGDSRVTRVGAILRRTSLDELPQLFNVIEGSMSLVGPRPHATAHNEQYRGLIRGYMLRHKVKPGITGLAQVNGCRGETETVEKMERRVHWDHQYIRSWSIWLDLRILAKTLLVAWRQPEAY